MSVFAWRTWNLNAEGLLVATAAGVPWQPGINAAECRKPSNSYTIRYYPVTGETEMVRPEPEHPAPESGCTCGYWAFKTPARLLREFGRRRAWDWEGTSSSPGVARRVYGVVELAGRMIELELGYKAQYARIVALAAPDELTVSDAYGVPVQSDLGALFRTWWDGVQPKDAEWREAGDETELGWGYASGGYIQATMTASANQMRDAMKRMLDAYGQASSKSVSLNWPDPKPLDVLSEREPINAENPAAEQALKVRAKNDRPKWQSTYGPASKRRK